MSQQLEKSLHSYRASQYSSAVLVLTPLLLTTLNTRVSWSSLKSTGREKRFSVFVQCKPCTRWKTAQNYPAYEVFKLGVHKTEILWLHLHLFRSSAFSSACPQRRTCRWRWVKSRGWERCTASHQAIGQHVPWNVRIDWKVQCINRLHWRRGVRRVLTKKSTRGITTLIR